MGFILLFALFSFASSALIPVVAQTLFASNRNNLRGSDGAFFGFEAAISEDVKVAVVSAPYESSCSRFLPGDVNCSKAGAAYVFLQNDKGFWQERAFLKTLFPSRGLLGVSVSLSADGSVIALGASDFDAVGSGVFNTPFGANVSQTDAEANAEKNLSSGASRGAVFVFRRRGPAEWLQEALILPDENLELGNSFGASLSLSRDGAVLAVSSGQYSLKNVAPKSTSVSLYRTSPETLVWALDQILSYPSISIPGFGYFVGLSGDGTVLCVASFSQQLGTNASAVFYKRNQQWDQVGVPVSTGSNNLRYIWNAIALNNDGSLAVIGVDYGADVFRFNGTTWAKQQQISPTNGTFAVGVNPKLSRDATLLVLGASPYVFAFSVQGNGTYIQLGNPLTNPSANSSLNDEFGRCVGLGPKFLLVSAPGSDSVSSPPVLGKGLVYMYSLEFSLSTSALSGQTVVAGNVTVVNGSSLTFSPGASVIVQGTLTIEPTSSVVLAANESGTVTFLSASTVVGTFGSVIATNAACEQGSATVNNVAYAPSTVSVTITLSGCGLGANAIAGIVVGSVVFLLIVVLSIVGIIWHRRKNASELSRVVGKLEAK